MPIRLGIVGCGWAASEVVRAAAMISGLEIVAVCDADRARAEAIASMTGSDVVVDIDTLIADARVTAVYVGLPHHLLPSIVERALTAGKHVLAEKPLALDAREARRLGHIADTRELKLAVFFELRRASSVEAARKLVSDGAVGDVRMVRIRTIIDKPMEYWGSPGVPNWRSKRSEAGGGVVLMNSIHQLDTLRYVTGLEFVRVAGAEVATLISSAEVEDAASASLRLSNGAIANLVANAHSAGAVSDETIEIDGTRGRLEMPDPYEPGSMRIYSIDEGTWSVLPAEHPDSHRLMLEDFVDAVLNDRPVPAGAMDAAAALAVVQAVYRSATQGRAIDVER